jgi:Tol biopolymer transport system component
MKRRLLLVAPMVLAMLIVGGVALSACGGGRQENNKSASGDSAAKDNQIVFRRWFDPRQSKGAIFSMNPDGSHLHQITHPPKGWSDDVPAVSPDGQRVAFERQKSYDDTMGRIMVLNRNTGDTREVIHCTGQCEADGNPAFSPDGESLSFNRVLSVDKSYVRGLWTAGLDGESDPHQVTNVDPKLPAAFSDDTSSFSPDGKMLVFNRMRLEDGRFAVFVQPIVSSGSPENARQITPWNMNCEDKPKFSPDGKLVLLRCLSKGEQGPSNLYWVHPDGTDLHALTHSPAGTKTYLGSSFAPSFAAGKGWIVAARQPGYGSMDNADVFRMRIEHGDVVSSENLTKSGIWDSAPVWGSH